MRRTALYSRVTKSAEPRSVAAFDAPAEAVATPAASRFRQFLCRWPRASAGVLGALLACVPIVLFVALRSPPPQLSQDDIDAAVLDTLQNIELPSAAARAYETILPSVVQVVGYGKSDDGQKEMKTGIGTGVVIVDKGVILTNLHVVAGADHLKLTFADGLESNASVVGMRPDQDLAVLQAQTVPDDLPAATMRSTAELVPGDQVFVVGFPFGIGPSLSAGVVSGLKREHRSPEGKHLLGNLIQFDAAANPGNSGGPLVTADGRVVGIVTGILNPTEHRVFIGIGFAVPIENAAAAAGLPPF